MGEWQFRDSSVSPDTSSGATYICRDFSELKTQLVLQLRAKQMLVKNVIVYSAADATPDELRQIKAVGVSVVGR